MGCVADAVFSDVADISAAIVDIVLDGEVMISVYIPWLGGSCMVAMLGVCIMVTRFLKLYASFKIKLIPFYRSSYITREYYALKFFF